MLDLDKMNPTGVRGLTCVDVSPGSGQNFTGDGVAWWSSGVERGLMVLLLWRPSSLLGLLWTSSGVIVISSFVNSHFLAMSCRRRTKVLVLSIVAIP